jgi:hypothetical protein
MTRPWGLLPEDIREIVLRREWQNDASLKARLLGEKPFPLRIGLKPPAGNAVLDDLGHFQAFVKAWRSFPAQELIEWRIKSYRTISHQEVPTHFSIASIDQLLDYIGEEALCRKKWWETNMEPLLGIDAGLYPVLVKHINTLETMATPDAVSLAMLIPQLTPGMGAGCYFRALPVIGVDTKFLEAHAALITDILDQIHHGEVSKQGGLSLWLECLDNPKGWLTVRPLCPAVKERMGGFAILQLPVDVLRSHELPAQNILVIENKQSGYHLPDLPDTVAVFGGGRNVSWMDAEWLKEKRVGYWGDIDTWGLAILSDVRALLPSVTALMMDLHTLESHRDSVVEEPVSVGPLRLNLNADDLNLLYRVTAVKSKSLRLEQEILDLAYIRSSLQNWAISSEMCDNAI